MSEERLARIEASQAETITLVRGLTAKVDERIGHSDQWRGRMERILHGNDEHDGLLVQVALLKGAAERQTWLVRAIVTAIAGLVVAAVWDKIAA